MDTPGTPPTSPEDAVDRPDDTGPARQHIDRRTAEQLQSERDCGAPPTDDPPPTAEGGGLWDRLGRWLGGPFHRAVTVGGVTGALVLAGCAGGDAVPTADEDAGASPAPAASEEPQDGADATASTTDTTPTSVCNDDQEDQVVLQDGVATAQPAGPAEASAPQTSDLLEARITRVDGEIKFITRRAAGGPPPDGDDRLEFHLQSLEEPATTGVVVLEFPDSPAGEFAVRTGPTTSLSSDVETRSSRINKFTLVVGIAAEDLPVTEPFRWFAVAVEGDGGDVCPNVTGFTATAELPVFPEDAGSDAAESDHDTVAVTGVDHAFEGVPAEVEAGTRLVFDNASEAEAHELVLLRLTDATPPVEEFLQLPMQEGMDVSELVGVSIALPGEQGRVTKGDLLLDVPGRYLLLCAIPLDTPPQQVADHPFGPPADAPPPSSPPHFTRGMTTVIEVTG